MKFPRLGSLIAFFGFAVLAPAVGFGQSGQLSIVRSGTRTDAVPSRPVDVAVTALAGALSDPSVGVRQAAIFALRELGPAAKPAIPALAQTVRDPDGYLRIDAAFTLGKLGADAVPSLVILLQDSDAVVRELAARTLRQIGPTAASSAAGALAAALSDPDVHVRQMAVFAIRFLDADGKPAIPALANLLRDPDGYVRIDAAFTLGRLGTDAIPSLAALLHDPDDGTRQLAADTLRQVASGLPQTTGESRFAGPPASGTAP